MVSEIICQEIPILRTHEVSIVQTIPIAGKSPKSQPEKNALIRTMVVLSIRYGDWVSSLILWSFPTTTVYVWDVYTLKSMYILQYVFIFWIRGGEIRASMCNWTIEFIPLSITCFGVFPLVSIAPLRRGSRNSTYYWYLLWIVVLYCSSSSRSSRMLWYCFVWGWKPGNYPGSGTGVVFVVLGRRILGGKPGVFPERH